MLHRTKNTIMVLPLLLLLCAAPAKAQEINISFARNLPPQNFDTPPNDREAFCAAFALDLAHPTVKEAVQKMLVKIFHLDTLAELEDFLREKGLEGLEEISLGEPSLADLLGPEFMRLLRSGAIDWSQGSLTFGSGADGKPVFRLSSNYLVGGEKLGTINVTTRRGARAQDLAPERCRSRSEKRG